MKLQGDKPAVAGRSTVRQQRHRAVHQDRMRGTTRPDVQPWHRVALRPERRARLSFAGACQSRIRATQNPMD